MFSESLFRLRGLRNDNYYYASQLVLKAQYSTSITVYDYFMTHNKEKSCSQSSLNSRQTYSHETVVTEKLKERIIDIKNTPQDLTFLVNFNDGNFLSFAYSLNRNQSSNTSAFSIYVRRSPCDANDCEIVMVSDKFLSVNQIFNLMDLGCHKDCSYVISWNTSTVQIYEGWSPNVHLINRTRVSQPGDMITFQNWTLRIHQESMEKFWILNNTAARESPKILHCDETWQIFEGSCYKMFLFPRKRFNAKEQCSNDGGHLMEISSWEYYSHVKQYMERIGIATRAWISGIKWTWDVTDSIIERLENDSDFSSYDPSRCLFASQHLGSLPCEEELPFVCEHASIGYTPPPECDTSGINNDHFYKTYAGKKSHRNAAKHCLDSNSVLAFTEFDYNDTMQAILEMTLVKI
ncbi:hypothetical protein CAPTEDRAFT_188623 [Capitella teleta]|uniref:C-type lectin domain-containing protein n=1 Tax=Capitella teleta TaxID=283909 RepID=R7VI35_CAPTE|nr:hypothetical protein CAPTEDRAFT_188623 [Capitella teleta]|eukprot:ELU18192.1 hypothetical protein CAPTEDRAFT_188623 [Capitella teleta]